MLRKKARHVGAVGKEEIDILKGMAEAMYRNRGIGLAAIQIGIAKRIVVMDIGSGLLKMVNPEIVSKSAASFMEEGCLSVPGRLVEIQRPEKVSVSFLDENSRHLLKNFDGLAAKAIQHEIDHLNGKLIIDYLPWYRRILSKKEKVTSSEASL